MTDTYDEPKHLEEMYAHFGRASYMANVVETELVQALLQIDFLTGVRDEYVRTQGKNFDQKKYDANYEAFMKEHFEQTMGTLLRRLKTKMEFDAALNNRMVEAKERRDFLVHNYLREMAVPASQRQGRTKMIEELKADADRFEQLAKDIRAAMKPTRERLGISDEVLDARAEEEMAKLKGS
jgi:hypothetical protein